LEEVIVVYGLVWIKSDPNAPPCALRLYWVFVITEAIEVRDSSKRVLPEQ
jgi:hypothetical protein